jgi:hypothetical protein
MKASPFYELNNIPSKEFERDFHCNHYDDKNFTINRRESLCFWELYLAKKPNGLYQTREMFEVNGPLLKHTWQQTSTLLRANILEFYFNLEL